MDELAKAFIIYFTSVLWEAMPFIVLGAVVAGLLEEFLPQQYLTKFIPANRPLAIAASCLLGLIFPMCECGIIVVMRRLLRKGLPLSCCVAYMLTGPIINPIVIFSTYVAFAPHSENTISIDGVMYQSLGWEVVFLRCGLGFLTAFVTSLVVDRVYRKQGPHALLTPLAIADEGASAQQTDEKGSLWKRFGNVSETALHDFTDITVFLILGALLTATVRVNMTYHGIRPGELAHVNVAAGILIMMGLAVLLCLCSEADAFVAASFTTLPPAAKLAFLVLGPMLDLKLLLMYTRVYRPRLIWTIVLCLVVQVFVYSFASHFAWLYWWRISGNP